jgi:hypothetical protein
MTAHVASLRVYEPLAAFDGAARARWEAYASRPDLPSPAAAAALERETAVRACALGGSGLPAPDEQAFVTELDGVRLVSPWGVRLRSLEGLQEFLSDVPDLLVPAYLPRAARPDLDDLLDAERLEHPTSAAHVLTSTWHVPLRWFVWWPPRSGPAARHRDGPGAADPAAHRPQPGLRTPMSRARRRVAALSRCSGARSRTGWSPPASRTSAAG